jgi:hypothetical protein
VCGYALKLYVMWILFNSSAVRALDRAIAQCMLLCGVATSGTQESSAAYSAIYSCQVVTRLRVLERLVLLFCTLFCGIRHFGDPCVIAFWRRETSRKCDIPGDLQAQDSVEGKPMATKPAHPAQMHRLADGERSAQLPAAWQQPSLPSRPTSTGQYYGSELCASAPGIYGPQS